MSHYLSFVAVQEPFPIGLDGDTSKRTMFSVNFNVQAYSPLGYFEGEVVKILKDAGLSTGTTQDTYIGPSVSIPSTAPGPIISVLSTGGNSPRDTHDGKRIHRLSLQVIVRAVSYTAARDRIQAIWNKLHGLRNVEVELP